MSSKIDLTRRTFLATAAAGGAASLFGCGDKVAEKMIPWVIPADDAIPGIAQYYRTVCRECEAGCGISARSREGRVVKLEGNPDDPIGRGALCIRGQAAIESLYHADRLSAPSTRVGSGAERRAVAWDGAERAFQDALGRAIAANRSIYVLTRPESGAVGELLGAWLQALGQPANQVVTFDPFEPAFIRDAAAATFGIAEQPLYDIGRARALLSIGADFLEDWGSPVEHARGLAAMRADTHGARRFVYVGPRLSLTAASADEWLSLRPGTEIDLVLGLAHLVLEHGGPNVRALPVATVSRLRATLSGHGPSVVAQRTGLAAAAVVQLGSMLIDEGPGLVLGPGRVVAGSNAVELARAILLLNALSGAVGDTLRWPDPGEVSTHAAHDGLERLVRCAEAGQLGVLVVHHADPLRFGAAFERFAAALDRIGFVAVFANRLDPIARRSHLVLPDHHFLETWSTIATRPGVLGVQQAAMAPLLPTRAAADVLVHVAQGLARGDGLPDGDFAQQLRDQHGPDELQRGGIFEPSQWRDVQLVDDPMGVALGSAVLGGPADGIVLVISPSLRQAGDGRAPEGLLAEIADPMTKIAWSASVELHPTTAAELGVSTQDIVRVEARGRRLELPVVVYEGVRPGIAAISSPFAADLLARGDDPARGLLCRAHFTRTGRRAVVPILHGSDSQQDRELAQSAHELATHAERPHTRLTMYPTEAPQTHRWGLVVDLDRCNGCSSCIAACSVENNASVVGPDEAARGRMMNWLRIERFLEGTPEHPDVRFLPVMCQQCSNAPCESVCPVYATYHTQDGLNAQVYNRCVGTRYCENNCPYQARRFNWFDYPHRATTSLALNPDVTVRERGVTEKCTFCIQRIREVKEQAKMDGRPVRDGEITPACAQTCPSGALVFGDLANRTSHASVLAASPRAYHLLGHLNTEPGVVYLARRRQESPR